MSFDNYRNLLNKIDSFVKGIMAKHPGAFKCGPGCAKCCVPGITVWRVEADNILDQLKQDESRVTCLSGKQATHESRKDECPFLTAGKLCSVYEARPVVCRLWGVPLVIPRGREEEWGIRDHLSSTSGRGTLTCCDLNFKDDLKLEALPIDDAINVNTAVTLLAAVNHVYCNERGLDQDERVELSALLSRKS